MGQSIIVNYTVNNLGTVGTTAGAWTDSVYLSTDSSFDASAILLGRAAHTGDVAALSSYSGTLSAPLPGLLVGNYHVIVVADSGLQVAEANRTDTVGVAATALPVSAAVLTLGSPVTGAIANGQNIYYQVSLAGGSDVQISGTYHVAGEANLFVGYGAIPDSSDYDEAVTDPTTLSPAITLAQPQGGVYYLLLQGQQGAGSGESYSVAPAHSVFHLRVSHRPRVATPETPRSW